MLLYKITIMTKNVKKVEFNLSKNIIYYTYSYEEYDRYPIYSLLNRKIYNEITQDEWLTEQRELLKYKYFEMVVHKDSFF